MALYQKTAKLTKFPRKKRPLFPAAGCGWDDVYYPQVVYSIFSTYLGLQVSFFLTAENTDLVSSFSELHHTLTAGEKKTRLKKISPKQHSSTETQTFQWSIKSQAIS